jgi:arabinogalactan oligomer/maltooligosaccharide transport system substrate-binding protein
MLFKRRIVLILGVLLLFLVACGKNDSSEQSDSSNETSIEDKASSNALSENNSETTENINKPDKLVMWVHDEPVQLDAYKEITESFTNEYGIAVEIIPYAQGDQLEGIALDGPSGIGPDLFYTAHDQIGNIYNQGLAAELEFTEKQAKKLSNYNKDVIQSFSYEGEQYGIPAVVETYLMFYNKSIIDSPPTTISEMMSLPKKFESEEMYSFVLDATNFYFVYPFLTAPGGYIFGQSETGEYDTTDIGLNTAGAIEGGELIQSWYENGFIQPGMTFDIMNGLFTEGKAAIAINGPWAIADYREKLGDNLGMSVLPAWDTEPISSFSGNKGWLVSYYSEYPDWATELALYITNAESGTKYFNIANELPANLDATVDDPFLQPILDQMKYAEPMPNVPEMSQVWEPMSDALQFISKGENPEDVLNSAVKEIQANIKLSKQ